MQAQAAPKLSGLFKGFLARSAGARRVPDRFSQRVILRASPGMRRGRSSSPRP
jgi:hypothetical protein